MVVIFSRHVVDKLAKELSRMGITDELLKDVVSNPDEVLYDSLTERYVALKMERRLAVIYEKIGEDIFIITAIYSSRLEDTVQRRRRSGRWI